VDAQRDQRQRLFRRNSIDAIEVSTASSYVEPLMAFFRRRERTGSAASGRRAASA